LATLSKRELLIRYVQDLPFLEDRFTNVRPIDPEGGQGFFSVVFRARDEVTNADVVLKFFDPTKDGDARRTEYFRRESDALAELNGKRNVRHVVEILGHRREHVAQIPLGGDNSLELPVSFYVMRPYSKSLETFLYEEDHQLQERLIAFREAVVGVGCAHRHQYCHRDLKPNNILMDSDGCVAVSDFGSAKRLATIASRELEDYEPRPAGHLYYTSPELLAGLTSVENFYATDLFALGLVLYEVVNRVPFFSESVAYAALITHLPHVALKYRNQASRRDKMNEIISAVTSTTPAIPLVSSPGHSPEFRLHAEELFKSLTAFSVDRRVRSFQYVFGKIDRCLRALGQSKVKREYKQR
jgi:serine/threonine protein kinase